jgi:histidinol-phosphate aminotransferase
MCRTFSKIYGLAAIRVGWAYCPDYIADILNRLRGPININAPAHYAAVAALDDSQHLAKAREVNDLGIPHFSQACRDLGLGPVPSVGNFVLVRFPAIGDMTGDKVAADVFKFLLTRSIRARAMAGYGLPDCIRFTIGTKAQMERVIGALKEALDGISEKQNA